MKKIVLTIREDVCKANGTDVNAVKLLEKMKTYGDVTDYDKETAKDRAEYQSVVDSLSTQLDTYKAHNITEEELVLLTAYRECKARLAAGYETRIDALEGQLDDIRVEEQNRIEQILALLKK